MSPAVFLRARLPAVVLLVAGLLSLFASCAPGVLLKWNALDERTLAGSGAGGQTFHAMRVETFGPYAEQIFGYFLYRDGVEVVTGGGAMIARLGKMSLGDVRADYARVVKSRMYNPRVLITREILRGGSVIGYTLTDLKLDVDLWDLTPAAQTSGVVLRLDYKDRRNIDSGGDGSGELNAGR